jgi:hypothetical protein
VLLAALLLDANPVVRVDALAEALWGDATPPSARSTVRRTREGRAGVDPYQRSLPPSTVMSA